MEVIKLDPKEFGVTTKSASEIELAFQPKIAERNALAIVYEEIIKKEITEEVCEEAGEALKKLVTVRTGIAKVHTTQKKFALAYGKFVDAWKNKETLPGTQMEEVLLNIRDHFKIIEAKRLDDLQAARIKLLNPYLHPNSEAPILYDMDQDVWEAYLSTKKKDFEDKQAAELKAEQDRKNALAIEKAARIKAEGEAKETKKKLAKLNASYKEPIVLSGDKDKLQGLTSDLEGLKTKYSFESDYNKKLYSNVGTLLDKIINYIK